MEFETKNPNQDGEEQENELGVKTEVAGKLETRALLSIPEEDESEELKETVMKQKNKMGAKMRKQPK